MIHLQVLGELSIRRDGVPLPPFKSRKVRTLQGVTPGGFLGGMCSPVHLCLALTRVYFEADWGLVYRLLIPAVVLVTVTAGGILWLSR